MEEWDCAALSCSHVLHLTTEEKKTLLEISKTTVKVNFDQSEKCYDLYASNAGRDKLLEFFLNSKDRHVFLREKSLKNLTKSVGSIFHRGWRIAHIRSYNYTFVW